MAHTRGFMFMIAEFYIYLRKMGTMRINEHFLQKKKKKGKF